MIDSLWKLFDPTGFPPRQETGGWSPGLVWLHTAADVLIWLALLGLLLICAFVARRRKDMPFRSALWLFVALFLALGFAHFLDALTFRTPVYRLAGAVKLLAAVAAWGTVIALVPIVPRALAWLERVAPRPGGAGHTTGWTEARSREYIVAILAAALAVLVRQALDPLMGDHHPFIIPLIAVIYVAWTGGVGPAAVTLLLALAGTVYLFVAPRGVFRAEGLADQLGLGLYLFGGAGAALLGEAQRAARRRAAEHAADLLAVNRELARSQREAADALAQLDTFLAHAPIGLAFYDADLRYVRVNRYLAEANRLPPEAHVGKRPEELLPDFPPDLLADYRRVVATGEPVLDRELTIPARPGGAAGVWTSSLYPVKNPDGSPLGLVVVAQDVTEKERAERRVRESEGLKSAILAASLDAIITIDAAGRVVEFNPAAERTFGYARDEVLGREMAGFLIPPAYRDAHRRGLEHYLATGEGPILNRRLELTAVRRDGAEFPVEASITAIATGGPPLFTSTLRDITERKQSEAALRESEARFRTLTQALPELIWSCGPDGLADFANQRWLDYTGQTLAEATGRGWLAAVHPDDRAEIGRAWRRASAEGTEYQAQYRLRRAADGEYRWFLARAWPQWDETGRVVHWLGCSTDIHDQKREAERLEDMVRDRTAALTRTNAALQTEVTERRRAEERERAVGVELRRSNEELEKFAYVASHDLQEPLRKIQAFGDRLAKRCRDAVGEQGIEYLDRILASAGRMRRLIDDLLTFSRVNTKGQPFAPVDLNAVAADATTDLELRITQTGARVEVGPLPAVEGDPTQLRQVFQNLIGNALKFQRPGVPPVVTVAAAAWDALPAGADPPPPPGRGWRITVADNGIGFEQHFGERIFEVFQRLHGRDVYEGTGIGLAICRKIIERHGGAVTARGRPGEGATFIIDLPAGGPGATGAV